MARLSLCMIARDEAARLATCLASTRGLVDECIVVDTGSVDATAEVARAHGARVIPFAWGDDFAAARNAALGHATHPWILVLDADETLPEASGVAIRARVAAPPREAYSLVQRNPFRPGADPVEVATVRLFPNRPDVRFEQAIHEHVNASLHRAGLPIRDTGIVIEHSGYQDPAVLRAKRARNRRIITAAFAREPAGDPHLHYHYASTLFDAQDWTGAAREYAACAGRCATERPNLAAAARLQAAECFFKIGDLAGALAHLPGTPDPEHHPRALVLRGDIAMRRGQIDLAHPWYSAALGAPDVPRVPPVALGELKMRVLLTLGDYWSARGRKDVGARVLRLALQLSRQPAPARHADLLEQYSEIVSTACAA